MQEEYNPTSLSHCNRLINMLESAPQGDSDFKILQALYKMKGTYMSVLLSQGNKSIGMNTVFTINELNDVLMPAVVQDPTVLTASDKPDVVYNIAGQKMTFKVDTGAVTSVVAATDIIWDMEDDHRGQLESAYETYVTKHKDLGPMTQTLMQETSPGITLAFPAVTSFNLITHEWGTDAEMDAKRSEEIKKEKGEIETTLIKGPLPVVGISNPKVKGVREGLRPVVELPLQGPGFPEETNYPFSLARRNGMTRAGLASRNLVREAGLSMVFDDRDTTIIDRNLVDFDKVRKALHPFMG